MLIKKSAAALCAAALIALTAAGCTAAEQASTNISKAADNFQVNRQLTVINGFDSSVQFQLIGRFSIEADSADGQLEVTAKLEDGSFRKHIIGMADNVSYVVEQLDSTNDADAWVYHVFYLPGKVVNVELAD